MDYVPKRGDAVWLNLYPQAGREQAGRRPVIVLSPISYNRRTGLAIVSPITSHAKGYTFEVSIPAGLRVQGVILSDHVKSSDWRMRDIKFICRLPESVVEEVLEKLSVLLRAEI
jgi:mRNA interferase MazF